MIRYNHIIFELIRLNLHCDPALIHRRRSYGLRFGLSLPILVGVFFNVQGLIMDASFLLIRTTTFVVFGFFLILITVLGISFVIVFFASIYFFVEN